MEDLRALNNRDHPNIGSILKKGFLATAFVADASMNVMKSSVQARIFRSVARCYLWLQPWKVTTHSKQVLCSAKFTGSLFFGKKLDKMVINSAAKSKH